MFISLTLQCLCVDKLELEKDNSNFQLLWLLTVTFFKLTIKNNFLEVDKYLDTQSLVNFIHFLTLEMKLIRNNSFGLMRT